MNDKEWWTWFLQTPKKGSGFDNFLREPHNKNDKDDKNETKRDDEKNQSSNDDNDNNNQKKKSSDPWESWEGGPGIWILALFLLFVFMVTSSYQKQQRMSRQEMDEIKNNNNDSHNMENNHHDDDWKHEQHLDDHGNNNLGGNNNLLLHPREISWHDFLHLLQQQQVIKIVVSEEREMARIYVKTNNILNSLSGHSGFSTYEERKRRHQQLLRQSPPLQHDSLEHDNNNNKSAMATTTNMDLSSSSLDSMSSSSSTASLHPESMMMYYRMPIGSVDSFERKLDEAQRALHRNPDQDVPVQYLPTMTLTQQILETVPQFLMALFLYAGTVFLVRNLMSGGPVGGGGGAGGGRGGGGGFSNIFQIGKNTAKKINKEDVGVTFKDVAGCDQAKKEVMEFVDFLKDSSRFTKLGAKIPKGALLSGPPGTGKTLLAKAVAGEAGVPFFSISGSDFIEMFVGVGPSRVRDLFQEARQNAPCIIFIDEIDAVGRQRGGGGLGGNDERENTLNQLLVEMDGFESSAGVVVLAGTNRVDILDQALTRPGRFDRQITVDKPDLAGRKDIFMVHLNGITLDGDREMIAGRLSGLTPGFAGADIANICNEAAIVAARRNADKVTIDDFEKAIDRVIGGLESNKIMSKEERTIVAHHEAGHAVAGWFLEHADPLMKVTIIPRTSGALGFAQYLPKEVFLRTRAQIMDLVCMALAGRAAEEVFFGRVTTGAQDDLKRVTNIVYGTIQVYGMNPRLGQLSFPKDPNAFWDERPYSEKTARLMDEEARSIVNEAYERTLQLMRDKKAQVEAVANLLLDKETVTHDDLVALIGERPFPGDPAYQQFVRQKLQGVHKDEKTTPTTEDTTANHATPEPSVA